MNNIKRLQSTLGWRKIPQKLWKTWQLSISKGLLFFTQEANAGMKKRSKFAQNQFFLLLLWLLATILDWKKKCFGLETMSENWLIRRNFLKPREENNRLLFFLLKNSFNLTCKAKCIIQAFKTQQSRWQSMSYTIIQI